MEPESAMPAGRVAGRSIVLWATSRCNNSCVFCPLDDRGRAGFEPPAADLLALLEEKKSRACDRLVIAGGEPTLRDDLDELVRAGRELGLDVLLQTNGRRLAYEGYLASLTSAGLERIDVSLHGPRREIHEHHTRAPRSFRQTTLGVKAAVAMGMRVAITSVITRSSFRHLSELVRLTGSLGASALHLSVARPLGRAAASMASIVPRHSLVLPHVRRATELGAKAGVDVFISGLAPCMAQRAHASHLSIEPMVEGALGPACEGCPMMEACPGLDSRYAKRYGFGELARPSKAPIERRAPAKESSSRLFAGLVTHPCE